MLVLSGISPRTTVYFPYYCNAADLLVSLSSHTRRASQKKLLRTHIVHFDPGCPLPNVPLNSTVTTLHIPERVIGGAALPFFFNHVQALSERQQTDIVVLADTDAFMLRNNWDNTLRSILEQHSVAGINPRCKSIHFYNRTEWNWIAFWQKDFNLSRIRGDFHVQKLHDWGEWFMHASPAAVYRWPPLLYLDGSQVIVGTLKEGPWVLHKFFGSRTRNEAVAAKKTQNTQVALHKLALANLL